MNYSTAASKLVEAPERASLARAWILAARPKTLSAAAVPVLVGSGCAAAVGAFHPGPAVAALAGALLIQIGTNFANDVFDYEKGADTAERLGPIRAVQAGLLTPRQVRAAMAVAFGLAVLCGLYLTLVAGLWIVAIGLLSIASGVAYTAGPFPLGYHGLGDVFVLIFFGFVAVCGTAFAQAGHVPPVAWLASIPVGTLATAILVVNNLRDIQTDRKAGKKTLAVRFGERAAVTEYLVLLAIAYFIPIAMVTSRIGSWSCLLPVATLPQALKLGRHVVSERGRPLNAALGGTAKLLLWFGVLFAVGIALSSA